MTIEDMALQNQREGHSVDGYLKSMSPREELACFMSIRGSCLMSMRRFGEAVAAETRTARLVPHPHLPTHPANGAAGDGRKRI
jgi:hypothetical protein